MGDHRTYQAARIEAKAKASKKSQYIFVYDQFKNNYKYIIFKLEKILMGKFLRDSRNTCTIKSFSIMNLKERMTSNFGLYIGFC